MGLAVSLSMDTARSMSKALICKARQYQNDYGSPPPCVIIDQERQVSAEYLQGFYSILEMLKNGEVTTMFQGYDSFNFGNKNVHVIVLSNTAPLHNYLSSDRLNIYEVLPEEYEFNMRPAILAPILMLYDGQNVQYRYISIHSDRKSELLSISPGDMLKQSKKSKIKECNVLNYIGMSAPITQSTFHIPENIRELVLKLNCKKDISKK